MGTAEPWWLEGSEACAHCHQVYVLEAEYRCALCDGATCGQCAIVVRETRFTHCQACTSDAAALADDSEGG